MSKYNIAFYYSDQDDAYITCVPELPGCMADGKTISEAIGNTDTVIDEWIETANEDGIEVPVRINDIKISEASAKDVAKYILQRKGSITTMALEKLVYYCKVWCLVWYGKNIISETPEAWRNGPVFPSLFEIHRGKRIIRPDMINSDHRFTEGETRFIDDILSVYGDFEAEELSNMTHIEDPWNVARDGLPKNDSSKEKITDDMILSYYRAVS
ncbi:MAG: DUF4065 domain-containing protein [Eubacterium sp.]|nr:DUF4065 domain-containing protein [Eubacterium sp.]